MVAPHAGAWIETLLRTAMKTQVNIVAVKRMPIVLIVQQQPQLKTGYGRDGIEYKRLLMSAGTLLGLSVIFIGKKSYVDECDVPLDEASSQV